MRKLSKRWTGVLVLACGLSFAPAAFGQQPQQQQPQQQDQGDQQTGQARVRTREGPRVELRPHHRPVIVAVFTNPQQSQQPQGALEITALIPAGGSDPSQARELVFESRNATENGIVVHRMDQAIGGGGGGGQQGQQEQARHLTFTARRGGQDAQIQELAGGQNVRILAIRRMDPQQQQQGQQVAQGQQGQQQQAQGQAEGQQAEDAQQAAARQQAEQQRQQQEQQRQQQEQQRQAAQEQNDAIVFIYLQGEQR